MSLVLVFQCASVLLVYFFFFFSSRRRHTRFDCDWSSDVCSSDLHAADGSCCGHAHDQGPRHIYIYSPAGAVRDKAGFKRGVRRLEAMGHQVEIDADALSSHQRFAGDDATRWWLLNASASIST